MALPPFDPASEPLGSTDPRVREVNSKLLDLGMHSKEDKFTDRFGEEKMTWEAMQNERLGLLIAGGQIFPSEAEGRAAAEDGWYYYAVSPNPNVTRSLYRRISASESEHIKDDPSAEFVEGVAAASNAALLISGRTSDSAGEFCNDDEQHTLYSIADKSGNNLAEWGADGHLIIVTRQEFYNDDNDIALYSICDKNRIPILSVDYNLQPIIPFMGEFFNDDVETSEYAWVDKNGYIYRAMDASGKTIVGGGSDVDFAELNKTDQIIDDGAAWINRESVSVKRDYSSAYKQSATTQFPTTQSVYDALDALMSEFPDYVSSFSIGQDGLGEEIMCYRFRSADYVVLEQGNSYPQESVERPKIIVSGGLHGIEQHVIPGNQAFFEELCRQWREIDRLDDLRWGVEFLYLPVTNPSGFSARTRRNHNNIDLNRNFPTRWPGTTASGPSPASEAETQSLMQFMSEHTDAIAFIDHHRMFQFQTGGERLVWVGTEGANNVGVGLNAVNKTIADIKRLMPFVPQGNEPVGAISSHFNGSMVLHAEEEFGIPGFLVESPSQLGGNITQLHVHARNCLFNLVYELFDKERIKRSNNFVINEAPDEEGNGDD
ncbi:DUF2817 domain-containing protein [Halomonas sp. AOP43-D1-4]|uniref:DUF2817 domain-containing protein n=1 Tax=Halomonas sp. AOP43-D1-4 TaxID=3457658 RepID=UPI0040345FAD